jgi:hypothetical protein
MWMPDPPRANLNRRMGALHAESCGQLLNTQNDVTDLRGDMNEAKADLAGGEAPP